MEETAVPLYLSEGRESRTMTLSESDLEYAGKFSEKISFYDKTMLLQYGMEAQNKMVRFTTSSRLSLPAEELKTVRAEISTLIEAVEQFSRIIGNKADAEAVRKAYSSLRTTMGETARRLELSRSALIRHISRMDETGTELRENIREFDLYLYAADRALERASEQLKQLREKAGESGLMSDQAAADELAAAIALFEKKKEELLVSRQLPMQLLARIALIQTTDAIQAESLQKLCADTFSLYRTRISLALDQLVSDSSTDCAVIISANQDLLSVLNSMLKTHRDDLKKEGTMMYGN